MMGALLSTVLAFLSPDLLKLLMELSRAPRPDEDEGALETAIGGGGGGPAAGGGGGGGPPPPPPPPDATPNAGGGGGPLAWTA